MSLLDYLEGVKMDSTAKTKESLFNELEREAAAYLSSLRPIEKLFQARELYKEATRKFKKDNPPPKGGMEYPPEFWGWEDAAAGRCSFEQTGTVKGGLLDDMKKKIDAWEAHLQAIADADGTNIEVAALVVEVAEDHVMLNGEVFRLSDGAVFSVAKLRHTFANGVWKGKNPADAWLRSKFRKTVRSQAEALSK